MATQNTKTTQPLTCGDLAYLLALKLNIEEIERQREPLVAAVNKRNFNSDNLRDSIVLIKLMALNVAGQHLRENADYFQRNIS